MAIGFRNIKSYVDAQESGAYDISVFRKLPSSATASGDWVDFSMISGTPVPNYYASSPLVAEVLESYKGIFTGSPCAPSKRVLKNIVMSAGPSGNIFPSTWFLFDYLLYYPFVDMDAAGETQVMDNTKTLPRYVSGDGVRAMIVAVAPSTGSGQFTVTYTNSDGVQKTTPVLIGRAVNSGSIVSAMSNIASVSPFMPMADGDKGIRSIDAVDVIVSNGGLVSIVLVKPIRTFAVRDISSSREVESLREAPDSPVIEDGAYLNFVAQCITATFAGTTVSGYLEFIWS